MWRVEYFCPRQGMFWHGKGARPAQQSAIMLANILKPPNGSARVIDPWGNVVYQI